MNVIKKTISNNLKIALNSILSKNINHFTSSQSSKLINHKLLYCNKWKHNDYNYMIPLLKRESHYMSSVFKNNTLIQLNLINAPPDCNDQCFHIDYEGDSISYFIPYVDINDMNGTEYLYFFNKANYLIYYNELLDMSKKYFDKNRDLPQIIEYMNKLNLRYNVDYMFKIVNTNAYSIMEMPNYTYHRGQKNKTNENRIMFNIVFSINNKFNYPTHEIINDTELDELTNNMEAQKLKNYIIQKRK
jgi:hypothetical protein